MTEIKQFEKQTKLLIDDLKSICANYGLGNDASEFNIITQVFLYKFLNDKFIYEIKKINPKLAKSKNFLEAVNSIKNDEYEMLLMQLDENAARFRPDQFISNLFVRQNEPNFSEIFDKTLTDLARDNSSIFSVITQGGEKVVLFENISKYVTDDRDQFCNAVINKLVGFSFEHIFDQKFDFYANIFEYLIKDYNSNSGGKYAEYFTPHAVAKIMADCIVNNKTSNTTCYDPSSGSGTLLMNIAHKIGEDKCTIFAQDISQKSSNLLRLNLILNNLVHSIPNIVKGNTILNPYHKEKGEIKKFKFVVSNPPFKLDFSDYRNDLERKENKNRFFAGIPKIPPQKKDKMAIYLLFIQHILHSLDEEGKAAIVVPAGFATAQNGIEQKIKKKLVDEKMLSGMINMPANIFATTGTNVSILFIDKTNTDGAIFIDASELGEQIKDEKNIRTFLQKGDEEKIVNTFINKKTIEDFSIKVSYEDIKNKNYSFNPGQFFDLKISYKDITKDEFSNKLDILTRNINDFSNESAVLHNEIKEKLKKLNHND